MKKAMLVTLTVLLLFAAACSGDTGSAAATTAATTAAATTTTAAAPAFTPDPSIELPPIAQIADLIPEGYPTDNVFHAETDDPISHANKTLYREDVNIRYFFENGYLMYAYTDKQNGPLCAREGCLHADFLCDAYAPDGIMQSVHYHNGRIYFTHTPGYVLSSINADGTDRRVEFQRAATIGFGEDISHAGYAGITIYHRGSFYFTWLRTVGEDLYAAELWRYDPESPEEGPQCIWRSDNIIQDTVYWYPVINAFGNYLYLYDMPTESTSIWNGLVFDLTSQEWSVTEAPEGYSYGWDEIIDGERIVTYISLESIRIMDEIRERNENGADLDYPDPAYEYITCRTEPDGSNPEILEE